MSANQLRDFHKWLQSCIRQYCLAAPWDTEKNPFEIENCFSKVELLLREPGRNIAVVAPGKTITVFDMQMKEESTITLVSPDESNPKSGKISYFSLLGSRLLGCKMGDIVEIQLFGRKEFFQVTHIKS